MVFLGCPNLQIDRQHCPMFPVAVSLQIHQLTTLHLNPLARRLGLLLPHLRQISRLDLRLGLFLGCPNLQIDRQRCPMFLVAVSLQIHQLTNLPLNLLAGYLGLLLPPLLVQISRLSLRSMLFLGFPTRPIHLLGCPMFPVAVSLETHRLTNLPLNPLTERLGLILPHLLVQISRLSLRSMLFLGFPHPRIDQRRCPMFPVALSLEIHQLTNLPLNPLARCSGLRLPPLVHQINYLSLRSMLFLGFPHPRIDQRRCPMFPVALSLEIHQLTNLPLNPLARCSGLRLPPLVHQINYLSLRLALFLEFPTRPIHPLGYPMFLIAVFVETHQLTNLPLNPLARCSGLRLPPLVHQINYLSLRLALFLEFPTRPIHPLGYPMFLIAVFVETHQLTNLPLNSLARRSGLRLPPLVQIQKISRLSLRSVLFQLFPNPRIDQRRCLMFPVAVSVETHQLTNLPLNPLLGRLNQMTPHRLQQISRLNLG